jgi:hypothetical protein
VNEVEELLLRLAAKDAAKRQRAQQERERREFRELEIAAKMALPREQPPDVPGTMTLLCTVCLEPFQRDPRSEIEMEQIRRERLICNNKYFPAICDSCLVTHAHHQVPPRDFHVSPNFMLRHAARWPNGDPRE